MSEDRHLGHDAAAGDAEPGFDRDVDVRRVVWTGIWLAVVIAVSMVLMWLMAVGFKRAGEAADPPPSPLPEVSQERLPPGPWLQPSRWQDLTPERELALMRQEERRVLEGYGWVNQAGGIARIPVERALEWVAEHGLPPAPPPPTPPAPLSEGSHVP
jgi:hypothetical protein